MSALLVASVVGCGSRTSLDGFDLGPLDGAGGSGATGAGGLASGGAFAGGGTFAGGGVFGGGGVRATGGDEGSGGAPMTGGGPGTGGFGTGGFGTGGAASGGAGSGGAGSGGQGSGGMSSGGAGSGGAPLTSVVDYFKSTNPSQIDFFGSQVALSADGQTLAVGVPGDSSSATGIDGDPFDDGSPASGAVFVFWRGDGAWTQQAYIKASNADADDEFGYTIALSDSGDRLAVGAIGEASSAIGVAGDEQNDDASSAGAVYVFSRDSGTWSQDAYLKASNTEEFDQFGYAVALSSDGTTLAVSTPNESSDATGVEGDQNSNLAEYSGAVYVFTDAGSGWSQQAYVKASNTASGDAFGLSLDLSGDGDTLLVGAGYEDSAAVGVDGAEGDNTAANAGAAYVFERTVSTWEQTHYVKASNTDASDYFGSAVALAADGNTMAIGAYGERSLSGGIDGDQGDDSGGLVGAAYVLVRSGPSWVQTAYVKAAVPHEAYFGASLVLSADGSDLFVGASGENGAGAGINGNQNDLSLPGAGAAYLFENQPTGWAQVAYVKAHNPQSDVYFGYTVALDDDASCLAIGAPYEDGSSPGINGDPTNLTTAAAGAAYVYTFQ